MIKTSIKCLKNVLPNLWIQLFQPVFYYVFGVTFIEISNSEKWNLRDCYHKKICENHHRRAPSMRMVYASTQGKKTKTQDWKILFENKWINTISSSRSLVFSTEFLLKIPVFKLNNRFVFHRAWALDIKSVLEME